MIVRAAKVEDAPAMAKVMVDTWLSAHRGQMPEEVWTKRRDEWTYDVSERGWARTLKEIADDVHSKDCIYVAEDEIGEIVGLAMGVPADDAPTTGEVSTLYVRESHQGHGIGRRLVQSVAAHLARLGMPALQIAVLAANAPARRFYEAIGGGIIGEREFDEEGFMLSEVVYGWADTSALISFST